MRLTHLAAALAFTAGPLYAQEAKSPPLCREETKAGFVSLFDGNTLRGWQGATDGYAVEEGVLAARRRPAAQRPVPEDVPGGSAGNGEGHAERLRESETAPSLPPLVGPSSVSAPMTRLPKHVRRYGDGRFRAVVARGDGTRWYGPLRPTPEEAAADGARSTPCRRPG